MGNLDACVRRLQASTPHESLGLKTLSASFLLTGHGRMKFVSFSQNLGRLECSIGRFREVDRGFYIDVGAADPESESVTQLSSCGAGVASTSSGRRKAPTRSWPPRPWTIVTFVSPWGEFRSASIFYLKSTGGQRLSTANEESPNSTSSRSGPLEKTVCGDHAGAGCRDHASGTIHF